MKTKTGFALWLISLALASCTAMPTNLPTETALSPLPNTSAPTGTVAPAAVVLPTASLPPTAPSQTGANPFLGYWIQSKFSEHALGWAVCGNFQNVEFFENGTFTETSDFSGIYEVFGFGDTAMTSSISGEYKILDGKRIEIKYSEDNITIWQYVFSGEDALTMSSPEPDDWGDGFIPCYFSRSDK